MSEPVVKVKQGALRGVINTSANGKVFYSFKGIPYAEPPVGNLRFKYPVPVKPWNGIKDATKEGDSCAQINLFSELKEYSGSDDCLYINVHTPHLKKDKGTPLPVMVNIHGGGFVCWSGTSDIFGPEYIMEEDVILVTFNYRLALLGFLCTDPVNARGDMGLLDQQLALKWVKQNIAAFNGDSDNITLFGISAGSASVEYHLLSNRSHDYFNKVIMQSGSTLNRWAKVENPVDHAIRLAKTFGYKSDSADGLFEFINKIDTKTLVEATASILNVEDLKNGKLFAFYPAVNEFDDNQGFITKDPLEILKNGEFKKVPIISGICEIEGMMIKLFYADEKIQSVLKSSGFFECLPNFLNKNIKDCDARLRSVYKKRDDDRNPDDNIMAFLSDLSFTGGIFESLQRRQRYNDNNEYFYHFAYEGNMNLMKLLMQTKDKGTCHADEHAYLGTHVMVPGEKATNTDITVKNRMVQMWTNFAKFGNPTPNITEIITEKWMPTTEENFRFMNITDELTMKNEWCPERKKLWLELYKDI